MKGRQPASKAPWVLAGALAVAAGLLASPRTYGRLRDAIGGGALRTGELLAREDEQRRGTVPPPRPAAPAAAADASPQTSDPDVPAQPAGTPSPAGDLEAQQIRERIDSARARVHERARGGLSSDR